MITLATRTSPLAQWQADEAAAQIVHARVGSDVRRLGVRSSGDADRTTDLARFGRIGIFTVEVDRAVISGEADIGVHSLKDMTTTLEDGMVLAGALARGAVEDVLVLPRGSGASGLVDLPRGARVATGSLRRAALVRRERPDVRIVAARGNVETRLAKLDAGQADALVLARAGLERLGLSERAGIVLDPARFVPAVGQGIVGLTVRAGDEDNLRLCRAITDPEAWHAALAERALLRALHGGCNAPIGGHARVREGRLALHALVLSPDGSECVEGRTRGLAEDGAELGVGLAQELLVGGAARLVEEARA